MDQHDIGVRAANAQAREHRVSALSTPRDDVDERVAGVGPADRLAPVDRDDERDALNSRISAGAPNGVLKEREFADADKRLGNGGAQSAPASGGHDEHRNASHPGKSQRTTPDLRRSGREDLVEDGLCLVFVRLLG